MTMNRWTRYLLNFLYPNRCPVCEAFLSADEMLCESCSEKILMHHEDYCHYCGKVACICKHTTLHYDRAVVCSGYTNGTVSAIVHLKKADNTNFAYFAAGILAARLQDNPLYREIDCVMPVPMHIAKKRQRGYNQATVISKEIARLLGLPHREDVLFKQASQKEQHRLNAQERAKNVDSFGCKDCRLDGMRILLCDDVLTTGNTMSRCAALLKENGAAAVIAAAAATTIPKQQEEFK